MMMATPIPTKWYHLQGYYFLIFFSIIFCENDSLSLFFDLIFDEIFLHSAMFSSIIMLKSKTTIISCFNLILKIHKMDTGL